MIERKKLGFIYTVEHIGIDGKIKSTEVVENIIPLLGVNYILSAALKAGSQFSTWYVGLFTANRTPVSGDDMTSFIADCSETSNYGSSSRLEVAFPSVSAGSVTTIDNPTIFTFVEGTTVQGGFITSGITINGTSGILISAVKFSSPKVVSSGELLRVPVGIALASI